MMQTVAKMRKRRLRDMTVEKFLQQSTSDEDDGAHTLRGIRDKWNAMKNNKKRKQSSSHEEEESS